MARIGTTLQPVDEKRQILLHAIQALGLDLANVSRELGKNHAYLHQYIFRGKPRQLPEMVRIFLSLRLGLTNQQLGGPSHEEIERYGLAEEPENVIEGGTPWERAKPGEVPLFFPGLGAHGELMFPATEIDFVRPPPELLGVEGAYGFNVRGENLVPAMGPGSIAWVNPTLPPAPGSFCIILRRNTSEMKEMTTPLLTEMRLARLRWPAKWEWNLIEYKPQYIEYIVHKDEWPLCHTIIGVKYHIGSPLE